MSDVRQFSIPYTWVETGVYLQAIKPYIKHVHSIYLNIPYELGFESFATFSSKYRQQGMEPKDWDPLVYDFLERTKLMRMKRIVAMNTSVFTEGPLEMVDKVTNKLIPFLRDYKVDGIIMTHFHLARIIKEAIPEIEIHTSCNCFQFTTQQMRVWRDHLGVELFNPPREIVRMPRLLKEMKDEGFKIKALVNEPCLFGCPNTITHAGATSQGVDFHAKGWKCHLNDPTNFFKTNFVVPRWLPALDPYVDVFKIAGRGGLHPSKIANMLRAYSQLDDDVNVFDIVGLAGNAPEYANKVIPCSAIPDKLLTCECKDCSSCNVCQQMTEKYLLN
jgi:collagenase-like PrtC family protease